MAAVDSGYYESQRRGIDDQYAAQMASNTFARTLAQTRGTRDLNLMTQGFKRQTPNFLAGFGQRGFGSGAVQSGVMQRSMQNYVNDFTQNYGNAQNDLTSQLRQFDLQGTQLGAQRSASYADLELQKARDIAYAAQNIEALRQSWGGT
jgi:hypothetical protein